MTKEPTPYERSFANRPRALSDMVPKLTVGIFGKKNLLFGKMMADWVSIAGPEVAAQTIPIDLKFSKKGEASQGVLHLAVQSAFALELSYQKNLLIERLNGFFGYPAVKEIKIIQNSEIMNKKKQQKPPPMPLTATELGKLDEITSKIKENDLQTALKNLGKAILSRQRKD